MRTPRHFQHAGIAYLKSRACVLLTDDPGLGKTSQAIWSWDPAAPVVVVCPLSVKGVWETEIGVIDPGRRVRMHAKSSEPWRWPGPGETVIVHSDILPAVLTSVPLPGTVLVGDEAHRFKSPTAQRTKRFRAMRQAVLRVDGRCQGLTGTPLTSRPEDLWHTLASVGLAEETFGSWKSFVYLFRGFPTEWGMQWGNPRPEAADRLKATTLGRLKTEVASEIPLRNYMTVPVSAKRVKAEDDVDLAKLEGEGESAGTDAHIATARAELALAKVRAPAFGDLMATWMDEGPVVVFSAHRAACEEAAAKYGTTALMGGISPAVRQQLVDDFQNGKTNVIVGSIGAMSVGLTLTRAIRVVFVDRSWTPADNLQAEDRAIRIGTTVSVQIVDLIADGSKLDRAVLRLLARKQKIIDAAVTAAKGGA